MEKGEAKVETVFLIYPTQFLVFLQLDFNLIVQPHFFQQLYNLISSSTIYEYHRHHPILRIITMKYYIVSIKATRFVIIVPYFFFFFFECLHNSKVLGNIWNLYQISYIYISQIKYQSIVIIS